MKRFITLGVIAILALGFIVGCEEDEDLGSQSLLSVVPENGYLPFPDDSTGVPDPDTLECYPYDPNVFVEYTFEVLGYTDYPEPDSSEIDSADWAIWIPKAESSITYAEFLAIPQAILPETTLVRLANEYPEYFDYVEPALCASNDCSFNNNKRGDVLLVRNRLHPVPGYHKHAGIWRGSGYDREAVSSYPKPGVKYDNDSYYNNSWRRCRVLRVNTNPHSTTYRSKAVDYCEDQVDKPYNWNYLWKWTEKRFYCSQLCWAGYYRSGAKNPRIDIDVYIPHWYRGKFVPDWHVAPDEIWIDWRTYQIAKSSGRW